MNWIETTQGILTLVASGIAVFGTITGLAIKLADAFKKLKANKNWLKIIDIADSAMCEAEKTLKSGKDKKAQVIAAVEGACKELGIDCDLSELDKYIDDCIGFVNGFIKK